MNNYQIVRSNPAMAPQPVIASQPAMELWEDDHLLLALNYGKCYAKGRHQKTSDADWALFCSAIRSPYSELQYQRLVLRLVARDGKIPYVG